MSELNFKPAVDTTKVLNLKYWLTTVVVVIGVMFILSRIMKQSIVLKDNNGNPMGTGDIAFKLGWNGLKA